MLSITLQHSLSRPRDLLLSRAAALYRNASFDDTQDAALRVRCHALAWRHLRDEGAQAQACAAFDDLPAATVAPDTALAGLLVTSALALGAGVAEAAPALERTWTSMEQLTWLEHRELYAAPVRNAEACAALLTAFETCGDLRYLRRAETLCRTITARARAEPWASCQWALSLLRLAQQPVALAYPGSWLVPHAKRLFDGGVQALAPGAGFAELAQALVVATQLAGRTGAPRQLLWQERIWKLCWHACLDLPDDSAEAAAAVLHAVDQMAHP